MITTQLNTPWTLGNLHLPHRLIQGPLAGYSCSAFRTLFSLYTSPAYSVSEMISAHDIMTKHQVNGRYLHRDAREETLCYQIAGNDPQLMANAAERLDILGANLIDINCGCPKTKIRKKGAGSALLDDPALLLSIVEHIKAVISCPLTVKIRLQKNAQDIRLAQDLANAGADALIVHGRMWSEDYDKPCDWQHIGLIKQAVTIPVILNGDVCDSHSLEQAFKETQCDAYMICRAGTGKPWLFKELLEGKKINISRRERLDIFMLHLRDLASLENEFQAVLQSRSLLRYYFREELTAEFLTSFYRLEKLDAIEFSLTKYFDLHPHSKLAL